MLDAGEEADNGQPDMMTNDDGWLSYSLTPLLLAWPYVRRCISLITMLFTLQPVPEHICSPRSYAVHHEELPG